MWGPQRDLFIHSGVVVDVLATYRVRGRKSALFSTRSYARLIRPGLALVTPDQAPGDAPLRRSVQQLERAMDTWCAAAKIAA